MDFRKEIFSYLIFAVLFASSLARNLRSNYKADPVETKCNDRESIELLKSLRNVPQFKKRVEKLLIVLTDSENNIYAPLKNELLQKNAIFLPLHKTFENDIPDIYRNALFLDSASYVKIIIHSDNEQRVANIFQQLVSIFKDFTGIYNCVGIALTLNNNVRKEQVLREMYNVAGKSHSSKVLDFVDRYSTPNGPPIAIFNNQSSNNPDVNTFLQDIYFTNRNENRDNFKFNLPEEYQTMINCAITYVEKQVIIDVNSFVESKLKIYFDTLKEPVEESLSGIERAEAVANLTKSYNYLLRFSKKMSSVQNPRSFLENLQDTFRYTKFEDEFEKTYFLPRNIDAIQFLYLISNYTFASALDEWTKPLKAFKIEDPDTLEQWYQKEEGGYFLSQNFDTKCIAISKGWKHQVRGTIIRLNEIDVHQCGSNTKLLEIFAVEKVFINVDLKLIGWEMQVVIIAPVWEVIGWPTIDLSGADAKELSQSQAKNGSKTGNKHGSDGIAGLPGGSSGNFYGVANEIINGKQLTILVTGGKGSKGQGGGNGANGEDGETFQKEKEFDCVKGAAVGYKSMFYNSTEIVSTEVPTIELFHYLVYGKEGKRGGRGGNGGVKGLGGYGGNVILLDLSKSDDDSSARIDAFQGNSGSDGRGGFSGYGGKNGYAMRITCQESIYKKGFDTSQFEIHSKDTGRGRFGQNGTDGRSLTLRKIPKTVPIIQNLPHTINEYKLYVRPKLAKTVSDSHVSSFYDLLNTRKEITSLYNTLSLVEEFTGLELQGFDMDDQQHLKPSFTALKERIRNYHNKPNYEKENTAVYQDVIRKLFHLITEKVEILSKKKGYSVMTNIVRGFDYNGLEQIKKLEKQEDVNSKLETLNDKINPLDGLIEEAQSLINNDLQNAMRDLQSTLDQKIDSLLEEISELKKNAKQKEKELNASRKELQNMILLKGLFGLMKIGCGLAGLVNPALSLVGVVASSTLSVMESLVTQNNITGQVAEVPKAVKALATATETYLKNEEPNKEAFLEIHISEMIRNATSDGKSMIKRMRSNIKNIFKKSGSEKRFTFEDRNEIYQREENEITNIMEQATKDKDVDKVNDCKISINVLKYLKVNSEVLQAASDSVANIMKDVTKIDEIDKAMKESSENLKKLYIMEEKVYNETLPMLRKMMFFTDQVGNDVSKLNKNGLIITNWNVSNTIQNVQKIIKESFVGFNVTKEMDWALDNLISTYSVMSQMHKQILEYGETKSQAEYIAMMHLAKERKILAVDHHLTNALAKLETALIYNNVNDLYKEWIFAFKQFSFPNGGDILKLTEWSDSMAQDIDHVIDEIKTNVDNFNKLLIKESNFDNLLENRAPKLFRGSCSSDETSFFVWGKEGTGQEINNILSGEETKIVANTPTRGINALKFKKVGILFTAKNSSVHERLFKIMKNVRVNLTHHGDSIYRFNNKTFEIKTNPTVLTFNYPSTVDEIMRLPSSIYEKISNGAYMLSPYATWTIKLISDNPRVFESLNEFKEKVDLELIGEGQVFESNQCDKSCEVTMKKYYKLAYEIYY